MKPTYLWIFILLVITSIIYYNYSYNYSKNGFQNWSPDLINRFTIYQQTVNENANQFNLDQLQQQASPAEAEQYLKTGYWNWSDTLKNLYVDKVLHNTIIKINPQYALDYAMKIYNKNAVTELLAWNTKEGQFLLYGGNIGHSKGMPKHMNNTITCSSDLNMEKKVYTGMNLWNGYMNSTTTIVKPEDIPKEMPGFSFINNPCNPCLALNSPGEFSCPFRINSKGDDSISEPWKQLWNLQYSN
jgi:hypothetical protein